MPRAFSPVVQLRRPAPGTASRAARATTSPTRAAGASAGVPRFAAANSSSAAAAPAMSQRNDRWETEASRVAEAAARAPATGTARLQPGPRSAPLSPPPTPASSSSGGTPLPAPVRAQVETVTGANLSAVRVHSGPTAHQAAAAYNARAFTVGPNIYLSSSASASDSRLLAHESAHTIQQNPGFRPSPLSLNPTPARGPPSHPRANSSRAPPAPTTLAPAPTIGLTPAPAGMIQREEADTAPAPEEPGLLERGFWWAIDTFVPERIATILHEIRNVGFWNFLKSKVTDGLAFIFDGMRAQGGFTATLADIFQNLLDRGRVILSALVGGDCEPLLAAVREFRDTLSEIAGDAWNSITEFLQPIGDYLSGLWEKFGAPVVDFLGEFASDTWEFIQELGNDLWEFTAPARDYLSSVWTEIKNLLGFGEGGDDDGSGGLVGWITTKAGEIWEEVKLELEPVIAPIREVVDKVTEILPLDAILNLRDTVTGWMDNAMQMADNMEEEGDVAENQDLLRDIVLPGVRRAIAGVQENLTAASTWVTGLIGGLVEKVTGFFGALSENSLLSPFAGTLQWLSDEATALGDWANDKVVGVFDLAHEALETLNTWIEPIINALSRLVTALTNLMDRLGDFVLGPFMLIPECIREPLKNFLIEQVVSRIPIFNQLAAVPGIWARAATVFRRIVVQIFRDGNLLGAAWTFFREVLSLFGLPPTLVTNLIRNAARAIRDILRDPVGFLINLLNAVKTGFLQFFDNFGSHLLNGIANWLFSALGSTGIRVPTEFSLRAVVDLVLQVLDITVDRVFQAIERRVGPERAAQIRRAMGVAGEALNLIRILVNEGPAGLWREFLNRINNLWQSIVSGVMDFLITRVVAFATRWLMSLLDISGIMPVINSLIAIYNAIQSFFQYLRQMMEILNSVFEGLGEIARGVITRGANLVEANLGRMVPIAIGFLANQIGLGDLPQQVRRVVAGIRASVDRALDWIVDRIVRGITAVVNAVRSAASSVRSAIVGAWDWLTTRERFRGRDGENHSIYVEGEGQNARVMLASVPTGITDAVGRIPAGPKKVEAEAEKTGLDTRLTQLKALGVSATEAGNRPAAGSVPNADQIRRHTEAMRQHMRRLAEIFNETLFAGAAGSFPATEVDFAGSGGKAALASAKISPNRTLGTTPRTTIRGWPLLEATGLTNAAAWVRLHIVSEQFQGPGTNPENLVPASRRDNSNVLGTVENPIKRLVGESPNQASARGLVWQESEVTYYSSVPGGTWDAATKALTLRNGNRLEDHVGEFASQVNFRWGIYTPKAGATPTTAWTSWERGAAMGNFNLQIALPPFTAAHGTQLSTVSP